MFEGHEWHFPRNPLQSFAVAITVKVHTKSSITSDSRLASKLRTGARAYGRKYFHSLVHSKQSSPTSQVRIIETIPRANSNWIP